MDPVGVEASVSVNDVNGGDQDAELSKIDLAVKISSGGEISGELKHADELLTRVELDLAFVSEKLLNLNVFMMHVAMEESDFETFTSQDGDISLDSMEKVLQFDLLSGILDSELSELDEFMTTLHTNVLYAGDMISSYEHLGEFFLAMEEKLRDSEESWKQSQDQVSEIKMQSVKFQRTLACFKGIDKDGPDFQDGLLLNASPKINMQTAEQQRHILRMLEKSLAKEMDLENKLAESRQVEEDMKHQLLSVEQETFFMEEVAMDLCGRKFEAENAAEVFLGISKELLSRLQILQFNLNGSLQREAELKSKLEESMEQLEEKDGALQILIDSSAKLRDLLAAQTDSLKASLTEAENKLVLANSEACSLREKMTALEKQLKESEFQLLKPKIPDDEGDKKHDALHSEITEMKHIIEDLRQKLSEAVKRAENSDAKCKLLEESNMKLNEELDPLKGVSEKVNLLERQLRESNIRLQHAVASAEASQEKEILLNSTIVDMENLIEGLKLKVLKAESRADSTEDKCIILSEANADLNEEISFLRGRLECVEASLNQAEETRMATAKDIGFQTKLITDLVMQLAIERERLHKQISSLALEKKILATKLHQAKKMAHADVGNGENVFHPEPEITQLSSSGSQVDKTSKTAAISDNEVVAIDCKSKLESVRRIDAGLLNFRHIFTAMVIVAVAAGIYAFHPENLRS